MKNFKTSCAITGHRPKYFPWKENEDDPRCLALKKELSTQIERLIQEGVTDWLSGMAEGVDLWAAQIILELREKNPKLRLHCILPCREQADKWKTSTQEIYRSILKQADSVVYVSRNYHKNCMLERNYFMVDHAGFLLGVGSAKGRSGTAATIRYAQKQGQRIILIDSTTEEETE